MKKQSLAVFWIVLVGTGAAMSAEPPANPPPAPASAPAPAAGVLSPNKNIAPEDLYHPQAPRDPFITPGSGAPREAAVQASSEFSIHNLTLKGILRDPTGDAAVLAEQSGASYILKNGRLYNGRKKIVPGITGSISPRQKKVHLMTPEKDVQTLILGEENKDEEGL